MSYNGLLNDDHYLLELITDDYPYTEFNEWCSDGSLELYDANHDMIVRLTAQEVDVYVNRLISDESFDNIEFNDAHVIDEEFND